MKYITNKYDFEDAMVFDRVQRDRWLSVGSPTQAKQMGTYVDTTSEVNPTPLILARAHRMTLTDWKNYLPLGIGLAMVYALTRM